MQPAPAIAKPVQKNCTHLTASHLVKEVTDCLGEISDHRPNQCKNGIPFGNFPKSAFAMMQMKMPSMMRGKIQPQVFIGNFVVMDTGLFLFVKRISQRLQLFYRNICYLCNFSGWMPIIVDSYQLSGIPYAVFLARNADFCLQV